MDLVVDLVYRYDIQLQEVQDKQAYQMRLQPSNLQATEAYKDLHLPVMRNQVDGKFFETLFWFAFVI